MNKVVHYSKLIRPGGGPAGYLYNLEIACNKSQKVEVRYEEKIESRAKTSTSNTPRNNVLKDIRRAFSDFKKIYKGKPLSTLNDIDNSTIIFHGVGEALLFLNHKDNLKNNNKYYLMMHSPVPPHVELASDTNNNFIKKLRIYLLSKIEARCLKKVDGIVVPNIHAVDNYYLDKPKLRSLLDSKDVKEVPTGIKAIETTNFPSREHILANMNVDPENSVVGYFGRFIWDKGFDNFKIIVEGSKIENITFISAGQGDLPLPESGNYINLGWRSDALELINAVDYVLVPNNVAYFDLIILEALSMGKRVITTYVGGSKNLEKGSVNYLHLDMDLSLQFDKIIMDDNWPTSKEIKEIHQKYYSSQSFKSGFEKNF